MKRAVDARELMDGDDLDPAIFGDVLRDLNRANALSLGDRPTLAFLDAVVAKYRPACLRILDVGSGSGAMLRAIDRWRGRSHPALELELVGIDLNPRSAAIAEAATLPGAPISFRTGDYAALTGQRWDIVISSLVTHHMTDDERAAFLRFMAAQARLGWFVNDLERSRIAQTLYRTGAAALRLHPIVRHDGALSVARGFVASEWRAMLADTGITDAEVRRYIPYRLCVACVR